MYLTRELRITFILFCNFSIQHSRFCNSVLLASFPCVFTAILFFAQLFVIRLKKWLVFSYCATAGRFAQGVSVAFWIWVKTGQFHTIFECFVREWLSGVYGRTYYQRITTILEIGHGQVGFILEVSLFK